MVRRVAAPAAAAARPAARPAAAPAPSADGNPVAMHPDGSAVNPELLMSYLEASGQLGSQSEELRRAVVAKDVAAFQVGAAPAGRLDADSVCRCWSGADWHVGGVCCRAAAAAAALA